MSERCDIVIAGGGMVGVSLALYLDRVLPRERSICLVEHFALPGPLAQGRPDYHPAFDARSTALSYSTCLIYEKIGVWESLGEWLCPIETIHVSNRGHFGSSLLRAGDYGWPALGYVVENAWLGNALIQALYRRDRVQILNPASVAAAESGDGGVRLSLQGVAQGALDAGLLIVADGADSGLRRQLGVAVHRKPYGQHALVANIAFAGPHRGRAFERFTDAGPLALLPLLPVPGAAHRASLVWSLPPAEAASLASSPPETFLRTLQDRFGYRLGRLRQVGERHCYPLALVRAVEQVRQGVVIMGNAAHALHPVAGQGYNLALRDVARLGDALARGAAADLPPGDLGVLLAYQRDQSADQERTIRFSDQLPGLFMQGDPALGLARDLALSGLDLLPALKREFVRHAAGVAAMGRRT